MGVGGHEDRAIGQNGPAWKGHEVGEIRYAPLPTGPALAAIARALNEENVAARDDPGRIARGMLADGGLLVLGLRAPFRRPIAWANRSPRDVRPIRLNPRKSIVALAGRRPGPCLRHRWIIGRMPGLAAILGDQHA